jgi:polyisoprenoid-binding protein YceI
MTETATLVSRPPIPPGDYILDPAHTHVGFVGRHLMVSKVRGTFSQVDGRIRVGEDLESSSVEASVALDSITTGEPKRDAHLRSADFFDVERFPTMTFRSTSARQTGEGRYAVTGDLTIRDQTHPLTLDVEYLGTEKTPWGTQASAITASAEIDREQWGLTWNVALESGRWLVGRTITLEIEAEIIPAPASS